MLNYFCVLESYHNGRQLLIRVLQPYPTSRVERVLNFSGKVRILEFTPVQVSIVHSQ